MTCLLDTEIDWNAYMQQVEQYIAGERDYVKIKGGTGPLVYPAAHVYIYRALYGLTDRGMNIPLAQIIFGVLYLFNLAVVMACYRLARVRFVSALDVYICSCIDAGTPVHLSAADPIEKTA